MKEIIIKDINTDEILKKINFNGGYNLAYANLNDGGTVKFIRTLDNGKFSSKHWIKNYTYRPIAKKLTEKFPELSHINYNRILFIEDIDHEPSAKSKNQWLARIKKANNELESMTGYEYILETRSHYTEQMSREQIVALIYHELRHIDREGDLIKHDIEDWDNMVATLGKDWATTQATIKDLLSDDFHLWNELEPSGRQLNIFNLQAVK